MSDSKPPSGAPPVAEFGRQRAFLARQGYSNEQVNEAIGVVPNGRTRSEISGQLSDWQRNNSNI